MLEWLSHTEMKKRKAWVIPTKSPAVDNASEEKLRKKVLVFELQMGKKSW